MGHGKQPAQLTFDGHAHSLMDPDALGDLDAHLLQKFQAAHQHVFSADRAAQATAFVGVQILGVEVGSVAAVSHLLEQTRQTAAVGGDQGGAVGHDIVGAPPTEELDAVHLHRAGGEEVLVGDGQVCLAGELFHALPAAQHRTQLMQPPLQNGPGAALTDECHSRRTAEQRGSGRLEGRVQAVVQVCHHADADADEQYGQGVPAQHLFRGAGGVAVVGVMLHLAFKPQKTLAALVIIGTGGHAVQVGGLAQCVGLTHLGVAPVVGGPQTHGHLQAESGTAGDTQLLQAEETVRRADQEGKYQQSI